MKEVDTLAAEKYKIDPLQMIENVATNTARFIRELRPKKALILIGKGNNAADGLAIARHLFIYDIHVKIIKAEEKMNETARRQLKILEKIKTDIEYDFDINEVGKDDLIIDCLIGYNLKGEPRKNFKGLIEKANKAKENKTRILSLDIPSGTDANTGKRADCCIKEDYTISLGLLKEGNKNNKNLHLANIGLPKEVYSEIGVDTKDYFKKEDIIKIS